MVTKTDRIIILLINIVILIHLPSRTWKCTFILTSTHYSFFFPIILFGNI